MSLTGALPNDFGTPEAGAKRLPEVEAAVRAMESTMGDRHPKVTQLPTLVAPMSGSSRDGSMTIAAKKSGKPSSRRLELWLANGSRLV